MNGLIEQAKTQLWDLVSTMGKAQCNGQTPQIEIALYEYGSPRNDAKKGYVKQISGFTTDLDALSGKLFALTTDGGDEYCGYAIHNSLDELAWDTSSASYKVIFIAGNEDFLQGPVKYTESCDAAKKKGVIVNTIYCGNRSDGIRLHWDLGGECGNGSYTFINHNATEQDIPTPYDSTLIVLNTKLNGTYIQYGGRATEGLMLQQQADANNMKSASGLKRIAVKGDKKLYRNSSWDLVDALKDNKTTIREVNRNTLLDSLKGKSDAELLQIVTSKSNERDSIQREIGKLAAARSQFIADENKKRSAVKDQTLQSETEKMLREQARRYNIIIQ